MSINKRDPAEDAKLAQPIQKTVDPINRRPLVEPSTIKAPVYGQVISEASEQRPSSIKSPSETLAPA